MGPLMMLRSWVVLYHVASGSFVKAKAAQMVNLFTPLQIEVVATREGVSMAVQ